MKRESFYAKTNRSANLLHIETDGCVVNIYVGLTDANGNQITRVDVTADSERRGGDGEGRVWLGKGSIGFDGGSVVLTRQPAKPQIDPRTAFSVGETVIIRDTSDNLDAVGDVTAIHCTEAGFPSSADVDVDGALHRVFLADVRHL